MISDPNFTSIIPILITLVLSLCTRNVVIGLFFGILSGVVILNGLNPIGAVDTLIGDYLIVQLADNYNAAVLVLLVFIGGFVHLMEKSGGGPAFAVAVARFVNSKRKAQLFSWLGGIFVFYSDIGTPLIVGPVFRPLFDKMKLSREKLALIIDSTASPVAILIPFIGWGVYVMSLIDKEIDSLYAGLTSMEVFMSAIPFQFYAVLAILIVPWITMSLVDFGPMKTAEQRALTLSSDYDNESAVVAFSHERASSAFVFMPLIIMAAIMLIVLIPLGFPQKPVAGSIFRTTLSTAYFFAAMSLIILMSARRVRTVMESITLYLKGMSGMMQIAIILILAWSLSVMGKDLGAPAYIANLVEGGFPAWLLPATIFVLGGIISFATGSSWGTFAILFPLVIPAAHSVEAPLAVVVAAVLSGGLFGDHCSPISETTILSSTGAGCDQFEHFRTQLPYALLNGCLAFFVFLIAGAYPSPWLLLVAISVQVIMLLTLARIYRSSRTA